MSSHEKTYQPMIITSAVIFSPIAFLITLGCPQFRFVEIFGLGLFQIAISIFLECESNSRKTEGKAIIYNRKEWIYYFFFIINTGIAYFLYSKINIQNISAFNFYFGLSFVLIIFIYFNIGTVKYRIINRNDYVKIDDKFIYINDNKEAHEFPIESLKSIEKDRTNIKFIFKNTETFVLKPIKLGLSIKDRKNIFEDLNSIINGKTPLIEGGGTNQ